MAQSGNTTCVSQKVSNPLPAAAKCIDPGHFQSRQPVAFHTADPVAQFLVRQAVACQRLRALDQAVNRGWPPSGGSADRASHPGSGRFHPAVSRPSVHRSCAGTSVFPLVCSADTRRPGRKLSHFRVARGRHRSGSGCLPYVSGLQAVFRCCIPMK